jgi:ParB family chromosome partitioning protein
MEHLAARIVAEGLSVRTTEEIVAIGDVSAPKQVGTKKKTAGTLSAPGLVDLTDRMGNRLDTRVKITMGRSKGKVIIEFATMEDLRRIVEVIDPPRRGMFGEPLG